MGNRNRRGFTLVELLVVIGIIAVLISILPPALNRVREKANAVKCMANLRSLGQGMQLYVTQTRRYPGGYAQGYYAIWPTRLRAVLGGNRDVFYCPSRDPEYAWTPGRGLPFLIGEEGFGYERGEPGIGAISKIPFSYGYNLFGTDLPGGEPSGQRGLGGLIRCALEPRLGIFSMLELPASRVKVPAEMIAIADSGIFNGDGGFDCFGIIPVPWSGSNGIGFGFTTPAAAHSGGANVLFCDGHVAWYPKADLIMNEVAAIRRRQPSSERDKAIARMWNHDHEP